jgi:dihydropyrimidine dehydrogenase (NADP+)
MLQEADGHEVPKEPKLPGFFTPIDEVDLSVDVAGVKFFNPFGLASAPPTTTYPMIKRAFDEGWSFALTKTFCLDRDSITNVSPRIYKSSASSLRNEAGFANIELISEKSASYWVEGAKEIIKEYPNHVLIGSIMCGYNKKDWQEAT